MKIILATRNPSKAEQIKAILGPKSGYQSWQVLTMTEANVEGEAVEDGLTLEENALKKARYVSERAPGVWAIADDTGLFIKALNGEPGILAARWAGEQASTEETMKYCLDRLSGQTDRSATFRTIVALISPDGKEYLFRGEVEGNILTEPRTIPQPQMPYSALFVPNGHNKTWAEMTIQEENDISHRGKAFKKVMDFFDRESWAKIVSESL